MTSLEYYIEQVEQTYDAEFFDGKCPYTGKSCYEWECHSCEVDAQAKKDMEELDKADKAESECEE